MLAGSLEPVIKPPIVHSKSAENAATAIKMKGETYIIDPAKCTECDGMDTQQCAAVCPVPKTCIKA